MKYTIDLGVRANGIQLLELTEEEKDQLLKEDLDEVYLDWIKEKDYEFHLEDTYLTWGCDRFGFTVKDENGNVVYETEKVEDYLKLDKTYNEDEEPQIEGWKFTGVEDGYYLTRIQTLKGCGWTTELELDEPFDINKLYILPSEDIDDGLLDDAYPLYSVYYQQGEGLDPERDNIDVEPNGYDEEQYYYTYLMKVEQKNWWHNLQEEE